MVEFIKENATAIYWIIGVLSISTLLFFLIDKSTRFFIKKGKEKGFENFSFVVLVRRILKIFIILFVLLFLTYFLVDKENYGFITENIKTIAWLSFVAVFTIVSATLSNTIFNRLIRKKINKSENPTSYKFLKYVAVFIIYLTGIALATLAFPSLNGIAQTALGGAGILAVVVGVASQEALSNLVGGFFIILFKPFQVHDIIKISDEMIGEVMDLTLRHTVIKNYENKMIVIPNAIINKEKVVNYNLGDNRCCQWIQVGISYDSDIDLAKKIMAEECMNHPNLIDHRTPVQVANGDPEVVVRVIGLNDSEVTLRAWAWAWDFPSAFIMKCDLYESIKKRFDNEGVEIPFPHRTLVLKKDQLNELTKEKPLKA